MSDWVQQHNEQIDAASTPKTARSTLHGITDADLDRQAEADVARGRLRGYTPVAQVRGEKDGIKTLTIDYTYVGRTRTAAGYPQQPTVPTYGGRSRLVGALLAIFLGGFGLHKFYTGKVAQGILYLLFFWTFIPAIVGFIEGIWYLTMRDEEFQVRYP